MNPPSSTTTPVPISAPGADVDHRGQEGLGGGSRLAGRQDRLFDGRRLEAAGETQGQHDDGEHIGDEGEGDRGEGGRRGA
jgi:hypothetical protein